MVDSKFDILFKPNTIYGKNFRFFEEPKEKLFMKMHPAGHNFSKLYEISNDKKKIPSIDKKHRCGHQLTKNCKK
jgi:hypothetical protein